MTVPPAQFLEFLHTTAGGEAKFRPVAELKRALATVGLEGAEKSLHEGSGDISGHYEGAL
jgi:hypothetical protein